MALRVSPITLASGSSEGKEALLVRDNNAAHDARTSYRSTSESVPPEATASEQQLALRVLATERVEAFDSTMLMDDRNLPLIQLPTRGGSPFAASITAFKQRSALSELVVPF